MRALEKMTTMDMLTEEIEMLLWKIAHDLPVPEIKNCFYVALANHVDSVKEFKEVKEQ